MVSAFVGGGPGQILTWVILQWEKCLIGASSYSLDCMQEVIEKNGGDLLLKLAIMCW